MAKSFRELRQEADAARAASAGPKKPSLWDRIKGKDAKLRAQNRASSARADAKQRAAMNEEATRTAAAPRSAAGGRGASSRTVPASVATKPASGVPLRTAGRSPASIPDVRQTARNLGEPYASRNAGRITTPPLRRGPTPAAASRTAARPSAPGGLSVTVTPVKPSAARSAVASAPKKPVNVSTRGANALGLDEDNAVMKRLRERAAARDAGKKVQEGAEGISSPKLRAAVKTGYSKR